MTTQAPALPHLLNDDNVPLRGIGADWLTEALFQRHPVASGRVADFSAQRIGTGQLSECYRVNLTYDGPTDEMPTSVIVKLPSQDAGSIEFARATGIYETENRFYGEVASSTGVCVPRCYYTHVNADTTNFALILEDLRHSHQGDQFSGATLDESTAVIDQIARLHASTWHRPAVLDLGWLKDPYQFWGAAGANITSLYTAFAARYARRIQPEYLRIVERFASEFPRWLETLKTPDCLWHSDLRLDNLMLSDGSTADPVVVVDWQGLMRGPIAADVSYFIGNSLTAENRRRHEDSLVRRYFDALCAGGVEDLTWEQCQQGYRAQAFSSLVVSLISAIQVEQTERGDQMFAAMVQRAAEQILDNDSFAALPR